ncbi:hypothetical protein TorRG33x02_292470 [Trema orientale]|uniref:Putative plant transposon protein domain-containing protein n=1 Tax=Trema orientale TaxID=63057 RepID=A0A2P5CAC8_TREOI|nr:hypothetical protein TorRG33x02_292470 [Trema orientale]
MEYAFDHNDMVTQIYALETEWIASEYREREHKAIVFIANSLNPFRKAWFYFICANIIPTRHVTEVTTDRVELFFCILTERTIDVGKVIKSSILHTIRGKTTLSLTHPSLIMGLCLNAIV